MQNHVSDSESLENILKFSSRRSWSARKNMLSDNFIFEVLDFDNNRIGIFNKGNDALLASAAPDFIDRFVYMHEEFLAMYQRIFTTENNSVMLHSTEKVRRVWSKLFKEFKVFKFIFDGALRCSLESILVSREARFDDYENSEVSEG